jgi:hypothetical protein
MSKKIIGIDVNEVLRARWLQYDRYYAQEFGEEGIPKKNAYVYDLFNGGYVWKDIVETVKELKEPEDTPEHINPIDYQVDQRDGKAPADAFLFKKPEEVKLTAKEAFNRFLYQDFLFEIHGAAPMMYRGMDLHVNNFIEKYSKSANFIVMSVENKFSIPPTLFFLSKITSRFKTYQFVDKPIDMWKYVDVLITTDPEILKGGAPWGKKLIKLNRPYNEMIKVGSLDVLQVNDLMDNPKFEKIIKYKK